MIATPRLAVPLGMMAVVGTLGYNFQVILPLLARFSFDGGAATYTALAVAMAAGSVVGALAAGARGRVGPGLLVAAAFGFGAVALIAAAAPTLPLELAALVPLGAASVTFAAGINSSLQLDADPAMRGRVMALYSIVFLGSAPIGGPIAGWLERGDRPASRSGARGSCRARSRNRRSHGLRSRRGPDRAPRLRGDQEPFGAAGGGGGGWPAGMRSRPSPGVRISLIGCKAEDGST